MNQLDKLLKLMLELEKRIEQIEKLQAIDDIRIKNIVEMLRDCLHESFGKIEGLM